MRINTAWLLDYLTPHVAHDVLVETFTNIGLEVEEAIDLKEALRPVRLGKLTSITPLENAPGMFVTSVELGEGEPITIVCGSEHPLEEGRIVPVAKSPVDLPTGTKIREGKVRGILSQGMICLDGEMGLVARDTGLQHWTDDALVGKSIVDVIEIEEWLVELAVLANRPDCLGVIGIARDVAAALELELTLPQIPEVEFVPASDDASLPIVIDNQAPDLCPRYLGQKLENIAVGPSPHWIKSRLIIAGSRPINNVVDITNFVLFEYGQPLHAFDFPSLKGPKIEIRKMRTEEVLPLLDDSELTGKDEPLVIADAERPVALAGIMGGSTTQTTDETSTLLLEAACFEPVQVRTAKKHAKIMTDSSYRFERGTDPNFMLSQAVGRAIGLLTELASATPVGPVIESYPEVIEPDVVPLSIERVRGLFGTEIETETVSAALTRLGMEVDSDLNVTVPTYRVDVNHPVVLIEDVIRMVGYDQVPLKTMDGSSTAGRRSEVDRLRNRVASSLAASGFLECRKAPLVDPDLNHVGTAPDTPAVTVSNPMRVDMVQLRTSLLPGLIQTADLNARRGESVYRFFEVDRTFRQTDSGPEMTWRLGGVIGGKVLEEDWSRRAIKLDFYLAKGIVENLLEECHLQDCTFEVGSRPGYISGETAVIKSTDGTVIGVVGAIDKGAMPKKAAVKLKGALYGFELNLEAMTAGFTTIVQHKPLARTPAVERDLAVLADRGVSFTELQQTITTHGGESLRSVSCIDIYTGDQIEKNERVLTIHLVFRDDAKTLTTDEVDSFVEQIVSGLAKEREATIRG